MTLIFRRKEQRHVFQISKIVWKITNNWQTVQINNIFTRQKCKHVWITLLVFTAFPEWLLLIEQRGSVSSSCYCYFYFVFSCYCHFVTIPPCYCYCATSVTVIVSQWDALLLKYFTTISVICFVSVRTICTNILSYCACDILLYTIQCILYM